MHYDMACTSSGNTLTAAGTGSTGAAEAPQAGAAGPASGPQVRALPNSSMQPGVGANMGAGAGVGAGADLGAGAQALMDAGTGSAGAGRTCSMQSHTSRMYVSS